MTDHRCFIVLQFGCEFNDFVLKWILNTLTKENFGTADINTLYMIV